MGRARDRQPQLVLKKNFKVWPHTTVMLESDKPESESSSATSKLAERSRQVFLSFLYFKELEMETSLVVPWLRICALNDSWSGN